MFKLLLKSKPNELLKNGEGNLSLRVVEQPSTVGPVPLAAWHATVNEALLGGFEVRGDQVGVDSLALGLEVDPVFYEELRPTVARGVPVGENGFVWVPPHPVGQHLVV